MPSPVRDPDPTALTTSPKRLGYTTAHGDVCFHGRPLALPPKERAALHLLLNEWPRTVSKEAFAQHVWAGQPMSDESLARCIAQLRQALPASSGLVLRAVYRRGYCLQMDPLVSVPTTAPVHLRMLHTAMALPHQVETLTHARHLIELRTAESLRRAEGILRGLVREAPGYTAAQLTLAECVAATVSSGTTVQRERIDEALAHLGRVATTEPQVPGLVAGTAHLLDCAWRFEEAAPLHDQALSEEPLDVATHYYRGWHLLATDRPKEAAQALEKALQLSPFSVYIAIFLARALSSAGDHEAALSRAWHTHENAPDDRAAALHLLAVQALIAPTPALMTKARAMLSDRSSWVFASSTLSYVLARCGESQEAERVIASTPPNEASEQATHTAALLLLGRRDEAMARLERAAANRCGHLPLILIAAENRALRTEARWAAMAANIWPKR